MYAYLVGALKSRLILELRDEFSRHPIYRKISSYIQGGYSFTERPEYGIVVKNTGANKVQLDAANFVGTLSSYVMLGFVGEAVYPIEWVREDQAAIQANRGLFPSPPGVYYIDIMKVPTSTGSLGEFCLGPLYTVTEEPLDFVALSAFLQHKPVEKTLRLYYNRNHLLVEGVDYERIGDDGITLLSHDLTAPITADYRYVGELVEHVPFDWNTADAKTIPGVVLAFGKRCEVGQRVAVVVHRNRVDASEVYGGKTELSFDLEVLARDPSQSDEIADFAHGFIWQNLKSKFIQEGIEVLDVSIGGQSEDAIDETGQSFQYTTPISLQLRADWEQHKPLPLTVSQLILDATPVSQKLFFDAHSILEGRAPDYERL
jgi:hypothetical protein